MTEWTKGLNVRGAFRRNESMAKHCSWRVGGPAEYWFEPSDRDDLVQFLRATPLEIPVTWVGLGSNVLVRDGGLMGVVIITTRALGDLVITSQNRITAEAGVPCAKVAKLAVRSGYAGADFLAGIPGSVGGALAMNAGAFGSDFWSFVESVDTLDRNGKIHRRERHDYQVSYRSVFGHNQEWFVGCVLRFNAAELTENQNGIKELLAHRNASQPIGVASCGSVFRNPPDDYAGRLIEASGLKGQTQGGCHVSEKHANFIINDGTATATDIETLIETVTQAVTDKFGITLQPEVRILGEKTMVLASNAMKHAVN